MSAVLTFASTHNAIHAERLLLDAGLSVRVMPLPAGIAAGCGLCLRIPPGERIRAAGALACGGIAAQGVCLAVPDVVSGGLKAAFRPFPFPVFSEALGVAPGDVVAIAGCGGKTALANRLAMENRHLPVLFSTTTRILPPPEDVVDRTIGEDAGSVPPGVNLACVPADGDEGKLRGLPLPALARLAPPAGLTILEADGSRGLPLKGWAAHEPAVPDFATLTIGVCSLAPLGRPLRTADVHRPELFRTLTGRAEGEVVGPSDIAAMVARMLQSAAGRKAVLLNQAEEPEQEDAARAVAAGLAPLRVVAGSVHGGTAWVLSKGEENDEGRD